MANNIVNHPIADNKLVIEGKEYTGFGATKIIVGVENPEKREIVTDKDSGLNYSRTAVEAQEVYCLKTQKHSPWFILDLETGQNGWYPGCEIHGDIVDGLEVAIKEAPTDDSATLEHISTASVTILEIDTVDQEPYDKGWYKILYDVEGYIKKEFITNLRYADPNRI